MRRRLVAVRLPYPRFSWLGLEGNVPDHPTFAKNRHGRSLQSDILR